MSKQSYNYKFIVKGHISKHYLKELADFEFVCLKDGRTELLGQVIDQSHLYSTITKFRDLGLELLGIEIIDEINYNEQI